MKELIFNYSYNMIYYNENLVNYYSYYYTSFSVHVAPKTQLERKLDVVL